MGRILCWFAALLCVVFSASAQDSLNVRRLGQLTLDDLAFAVVVQGNHAYVAADAAGLSILDISNPAAPVEVGVYHTPGWAFGVAVSGNYAYVADYITGLRIVNVADPAVPVEVGFYDAWWNTVGVAVSGNYAYVACEIVGRRGGLRIVDITSPAAPAEVGYDTLRDCWGVAVSGNYAYVTAGGLRIVDVSNPATPAEVGFYNAHGRSFGVALSGDHAYVADADSGLRIVNVADPAAPVEVGVYHTPGAFGVAVSGNYAYVADADSGLRIVNVANPAAPVEVGFYDAIRGARGVAVDGSVAYVAASGYFGIYDCSAAVSVSDHFILHPSSYILSVYPNPCNATTTISFDVPRVSQVELKVFDVTGRIAQNLASRVYDAGEYSILFNGSGLASGVYFVQMLSGEFARTQKIVLLK